MDVATLRSKIKSNKLPSFMIFAGDEWLVQKIYVQQISKVTGLELSYIDSILDIYSKLKSKSFANKSYCYVVRDDKDIISNEKLQDQIEHGLLGKNMFILLVTTIDKRLKFFKNNSDNIVEFEPLTDVLLKKYIKKEISLSDSNCDRLIDVCEHNYGRILLEIDKIKMAGRVVFLEVGNDKNYDANAVLKMLLDDGTIYQPPKDAIFDLVDSILDRKVNRTFELLRQSYAVGEATLVMLSVLYNNAKAVLQVQSCESDDVSKSTGLTGWQIKNAQPHIDKYRTGELVSMLKLIRELEVGIKIGRIDEQYVMDRLLTEIL